MKLPIPKALERRLAPVVERGNQFLRTWEWTWAAAVVACVAIVFAAIIFLAVIPSFWLYYAQNTLRWQTFWLTKLRDAIAAGWITFWFANFFIIAYLLQKQRQKLRGTGGDTRPTGGYR